MRLDIINKEVIITFGGQEAIWSLKQELVIPLKEIKKVHLTPIRFKFTCLKMGGTAIPGFYAGRFWTKRDGMWYKEFWYVNCAKPQLVIELIHSPVNWFLGCFGAPYMRIILGTHEAAAFKKMIDLNRKR